MKTLLGSLFILLVILPITLLITLLIGVFRIVVDLVWVVATLVMSVFATFSMKD